MTSKWETVQLSNLLLHVIGGAWGKPPGESDVDVIAFGTKAFVNGATLLNPESGTLRSISKAQYDKRQLFEGDIILEVSGGSPSQPVGRALYVDRDLPEVIPSSFMRLMRFDHSRIVPAFAFQLLQFLYQTGVTAACQTNTTGIRNLSVPDFLRTRIALPSLPEQRRIVDLIGALDDAIEAAEDELQSCLNVEKSFLTRTMTSAYASETVPLSSVANSRLGKMLSSTTATDEPLAPYVRNANVQWDELRLDDLKEMPFSSADRVEFSLVKNDVLICEGGEIGRTVVLNEDLPGLFFQKAVHRVRCSELLDPHYLSMCMRHMAENGTLDLFSGGSTIPHLTGQKLRKLPIPVASIEEQRRSVVTMRGIIEARQEQKEHVNVIRTLRTELLTALLSGAHEIPESYDSVMELAGA